MAADLDFPSAALRGNVRSMGLTANTFKTACAVADFEASLPLSTDDAGSKIYLAVNLGTVTEKNWAGVTLKWDNRSQQSVLHNDMASVGMVSKK